MNPVSSIALSSMSFASARLTRSAENVANVNTNGFEAQRQVAREALNGGVTSTTEPTYAPAPTFERGAEEVLGSNTDLISETVEQLGAMQQFKASIALLKTDQEMQKSLLDINA
ncbi:MAG TPA: flagellar basal body rod C-terminal domain-containing protein [Polyangiales bacterium]|nr:flagellar basal body rod C-terminal domain-containing protein [Polyangiales bacterium]